LTSLVGPNGGGKSAFLKALDLFYHSARGQLTADDFYGRDTSQNLLVTVEFSNLSEEELQRFQVYTQGGLLRISLVCRWEDGAVTPRYYATRLRSAVFDNVRAIRDGRQRVAAFNALVSDGTVAGLSRVRLMAEADAEMEAWELAHPGECEARQDEVQPWGWQNVLLGRMGEHTRLVLIPAVREASEEAGGRGSSIEELVSALREELMGLEELEKLSQTYAEGYRQLVDHEREQRLPALSTELSQVLQTYVPGAEVRLDWQVPDSLSLPPPATMVHVTEERFESDIGRKGHGLQRAFILAVLQYMAQKRAARDAERAREGEEVADQKGGGRRVHVVLAIEEPELYQHPIQARRLARAMQQLSNPDGQANAAFQIVYSTHCPYFVDVGSYETVRLVRKVPAVGGLPPRTRVTWTADDDVARRISQAKGSAYSPARLRASLPAVMSPAVSEGFFARTVVLVEGDEDCAAIVAAARWLNVDLEAEGIAVIPVDGKCNLDRPFTIFTLLGIPCYVVFDGDAHKRDEPDNGHPNVNLELLRLLGAPEVEFPETSVCATHAIFQEELQRQLAQELPWDSFVRTRNEVAEAMGWARPSEARKNATVLEQTFRQLSDQGITSPTLEGIVRAIVRLARETRDASEGQEARGGAEDGDSGQPLQSGEGAPGTPTVDAGRSSRFL
jgi:energy-coupling factor transporter ATP-binding protein EcfA2